MIRVHKVVESSIASGPGRRLLLVLQGCSLGCPDCLVPETHSNKRGREESVAFLVQYILSIQGIQGITITGGEPMEQAQALLQLIQGIRESSNLSVFLYTGHEINELQSHGTRAQLQLILAVDILCDGPYMIDLATQKNLWRGSSNQKIYAFSDKGRNEIKEYSQPMQMTLQATPDDWQIVGIPTKDMVDLLQKGFFGGRDF